MSISGKQIADEMIVLKSTCEKFTPVQMGYLALRFGLNFKATGEWLEECRLVPSGTTDRLKEFSKIIDSETGKRRNLKVQDILDAAIEWHQATYGKPIELWFPESRIL